MELNIKNLKSYLKSIVEFLLVSILLIILFTTLLQVAVRYFRLPIQVHWAEEVARFLNVWLTFLGGAYIVGKHINVDILEGRISPKVAKCMEFFSHLVICIFSSVVLWGSINKVITQTHLVTPAANISMSLFYVAVLVSSLVFVLYNVMQIFRIIRKQGV